MSALQRIPCPLCGEAQRFLPVRSSAADPYVAKLRESYGDEKTSKWSACGRCGFVHQNPRPTLAALRGLWSDSTYHGEAVDPRYYDLVQYRDFCRWYYGDKVAWAIAESGMRGGAAFELGACTGGALDQIRQRGFDVYGVEPDPKQAAFAREVLGLDVKNAVLDASTELPAPIDLAFSNHVFEHIDDLQSAMAGLTRVMRRGGYVFTCVPTYARNRSDLSIRWMNAGHLSMFTHRSLNQLFARFGFVEVTHTYRGWWKEVDDLWHLARYEGSAPAPETFYEDARSVQRYIGVVNRLRSAAYWPVFHDWERKYALAARVKKAALGWARR